MDSGAEGGVGSAAVAESGEGVTASLRAAVEGAGDLFEGAVFTVVHAVKDFPGGESRPGHVVVAVPGKDTGAGNTEVAGDGGDDTLVVHGLIPVVAGEKAAP